MTELEKLYEDIDILLERNATKPEAGGAAALKNYGKSKNGKLSLKAADKGLASKAFDGWQYQGYKKTDNDRRCVFLYRKIDDKNQWGYYSVDDDGTEDIQAYKPGVDPSGNNFVAAGLAEEPAEEPAKEPAENPAPEDNATPTETSNSQQTFNNSVLELINNNSVKNEILNNGNIQSIKIEGNNVILESLNSVISMLEIKIPEFISNKFIEAAASIPFSTTLSSLTDIMDPKYAQAISDAGITITMIHNLGGKIQYVNGDKDITPSVEAVINKIKGAETGENGENAQQGSDVQTASISNAVKSSELVEAINQINKQMGEGGEKLIKNLDGGFKHFKLSSISFGDAIKGTYIQESNKNSDSEFHIREDNAEASKTNAKEGENKETAKKDMPSGGAEFYIIANIKFNNGQGNEQSNNEPEDGVETKTKNPEEKDVIKDIESLPKKVCDAFNGYKVQIKSKVKDEGLSFTGEQTVKTPITFKVGPAEHQKLGDLGVQDGKVTVQQAQVEFTLIANKGNEKTNGFLNALNKIAGGMAAVTGAVTNASKNTATGTNRL